MGYMENYSVDCTLFYHVTVAIQDRFSPLHADITYIRGSTWLNLQAVVLLFYNDDLQYNLKAECLFYANDFKFFSTDDKFLQKDVDTVATWADD